jgi:hypothetical protein
MNYLKSMRIKRLNQLVKTYMKYANHIFLSLKKTTLRLNVSMMKKNNKAH